MNKLIRILQVIFAQTPEDKQRRQLNRYIDIISRRHPSASEATGQWVLIQNNIDDSLRDTLNQNAVKLDAYWIGIMHIASSMEYLVYLDTPGDKPLCIYSDGWKFKGPWQDDLPKVLHRVAAEVCALPSPEQREQIKQQERAARAAEQFVHH